MMMMGKGQLIMVVAMAAIVVASAKAATIQTGAAGESSLFEIDIFTSNCQDCGMPSFLGELSVKVYLPLLTTVKFTPVIKSDRLYNPLLDFDTHK